MSAVSTPDTRSGLFISIENIATRLRPFAPKQVDIIIAGDAPEISDIAEAIGSTILQSGWTIRAGVRGVSALRAEGIVSDGLKQFGDELLMVMTGDWGNAPIAHIRILVGAKP